jgi:membrane protein YqaA with SNARE-associated domain
VAGTYAYCVVSGLVPFVNAEIYLLAASAAAPREMAGPLVLAATLGQMTAKVAMYGAGRGVIRVPGARMKRWIADAEAWAQTRPSTGGGLVLVSAASGFPPFYFVSIACGMLKVAFVPFVTMGFLGRLIRFGIIVLFPQIAKALGGR